MGGTISRIFHRKPDDETKPKVKKPRRFGSLRRHRTDDAPTGTRVSRSSTMPSRTRHVNEEQRVEERREIMREVMDAEETVAPIVVQQITKTELISAPEIQSAKIQLKTENSDDFVAVHMVSETSKGEAVEKKAEPEVILLQEAQQTQQECAPYTEQNGISHQEELPSEQIVELKTAQYVNEQPNEDVKESFSQNVDQTDVVAKDSELEQAEQAVEQIDEVIAPMESNENVGEYAEHFHAEQGELTEVQHVETLHPEPTHEQADESSVPYSEVKDVHEHTEECIDAVVQETVANPPSNEPYELESEVLPQHEEFDRAQEKVEELPTENVGHVEVPQEVEDIQHFQPPHENESEDISLHKEIGHAEAKVEEVPVEHVEHTEIPQEAEDIQHSEPPHEHESEDLAPHEEVDHAESKVEELPVDHAEIVPEAEDIQHSEPPHEHESEDLAPHEELDHAESKVEELPVEHAEHSEITQEVEDIQHSEPPHEHECEGVVPQEATDIADAKAEEVPVEDAEYAEIPQEAEAIQPFEESHEHDAEAVATQNDVDHAETKVEEVPLEHLEHAEITQGEGAFEHSVPPHGHEGEDVNPAEELHHTEAKVEEVPIEHVEHAEQPQENLDTQNTEQAAAEEEPAGDIREEQSEHADISPENAEIQQTEQSYEHEDNEAVGNEDVEQFAHHGEESCKTNPENTEEGQPDLTEQVHEVADGEAAHNIDFGNELDNHSPKVEENSHPEEVEPDQSMMNGSSEVHGANNHTTELPIEKPEEQQDGVVHDIIDDTNNPLTSKLSASSNPEHDQDLHTNGLSVNGEENMT